MSATANLAQFPSKESHTSVKEMHWRIAVETGGGTYVGIQKRGVFQPFRDKNGEFVDAAILFASRETGTCLGLPASQLNQRNVRRQIKDSNALFAPFCERAATFVLRGSKSLESKVLVCG